MNILFLTLYDFNSLQERNIYPDLLREFIKNRHKIYVISPVEKRNKVKTHIIREENAVILKLEVGNTQKTNIVEKGISTVLIEPQFKRAIKKYFSEVSFDLILYSTPPITLLGAIEYVIKRDSAKSYLLLKDIFPQNALDIGLLTKRGPKGFLLRRFRKKEKRLYAVSDHIGCMSLGNVNYLLEHNPEVGREKVGVCPNSIEVTEHITESKQKLRAKYGLPEDKLILVYGGNLGKPQDVPYIIRCIDAAKDDERVFYLVIGNGTDYPIMERYAETRKMKNLRIIQWLPTSDYDSILSACDVGMIFLDHRFTIPNFPSRLLGYMQAKLPVLAVTDPNTDIGKIITEGGFGWWCESNDPNAFVEKIQQIKQANLEEMGERGYQYLKEHYDVKTAYRVIMDSIGKA